MLNPRTARGQGGTAVATEFTVRESLVEKLFHATYCSSTVMCRCLQTLIPQRQSIKEESHVTQRNKHSRCVTSRHSTVKTRSWCFKKAYELAIWRWCPHTLPIVAEAAQPRHRWGVGPSPSATETTLLGAKSAVSPRATASSTASRSVRTCGADEYSCLQHFAVKAAHACGSAGNSPARNRRLISSSSLDLSRSGNTS